jgi:acetyl esterase/lipase
MSGAALIARALLFSALLVGNASAQGVTVVGNVVYAPGLQLDVYEPAERGTTPRPAVVLIHGGGWTSLDKSTMTGMGNFLARKGFVAFSVDYRLYDGTKNRWPAQLDDVQRAVRWVRANATTYGVNAERIGAFGHSAGGQLAALLGMEDTRDNSDTALSRYSSRVQAVVDASAPSDFTAEKDHDNVTFLISFLGADSSQHAMWRDASPVFHARKGDAPFLVVHGTRDESVPIAQAQELVDTLQAKGANVSFLKIDDGHTFQGEGRLQLAIETLAFFHQYLDTP